jgi:putative Holliday junction resolvase
MANILGIDYGQKYIGYAIGNDITLTSSTLGTIIYKNQKKLFQEIQDLVNEWEVKLIILGLPINMDDTESKMSKEVRGFKEKIEKSLNIECKLHDERLSSFEAKEQKEIIKKNKNKVQLNPGIDALAAQVILESWLREKGKNV